MKVTFITSVKICKGYEWIEDALQTYINIINEFCKVPYEILIGEDLNHKNLRRVKLTGKHLRIIDVPATYPNPLNFNMIESYSKNACLREARGEYVCMTSADQILSNDFFTFLESDELSHQTFYRFATYEIPRFDSKSMSPVSILKKCEIEKPNGRLCNEGCFVTPLTPAGLAQKSGDIMLLDTESFHMIKGWPENECFHHVDYSVCMVAYNVFKIYVPPKHVCSYTLSQPNRPQNTEVITITVELYETLRAFTYSGERTCND